MRAGDAAEARALGVDPRRLLRATFRHSLIPPRAAFVDVGKDGHSPLWAIAAMWGMGGDIISDEGRPWLVTAHAVERVPVSFVRLARREVAGMQARRRFLVNFVAADYRGAIRLLESLGFIVEPPAPIRAPARGVPSVLDRE